MEEVICIGEKDERPTSNVVRLQRIILCFVIPDESRHAKRGLAGMKKNDGAKRLHYSTFDVERSMFNVHLFSEDFEII